MPTRYLKPGIRDSGHIEMLADCPDAECLYYRLLVTVDDFGRFDARPLVVKGQCFPLRVRATADNCMQWLKQLHSAGLIVLYLVDHKEYLQICKWDNKPRAESSKFPPIPASADTCIQLHTVAPLTVTDVPELELKPEQKQTPLSGTPDGIPAEKPKSNGNAQYLADAESVMQYLNKSAGKGFDFRNRSGELTASALKIIARLKQGYTAEELREVVLDKCRQWGGDERMVEYLRPNTLFGKEKFEQYLGELRNG